LGLARPTGKLEYFAERSEMEWDKEPGIKCSRTLKYGVKDDDRIPFEISFVQKLFDE
jgi:hypothetical protein